MCVGVFPLNAKILISKWFMSFSSFAFCVMARVHTNFSHSLSHTQHILIKSPSLSRIFFFIPFLAGIFHTLLGCFCVWMARRSWIVNYCIKRYKFFMLFFSARYQTTEGAQHVPFWECKSHTSRIHKKLVVIIYNPRLW